MSTFGFDRSGSNPSAPDIPTARASGLRKCWRSAGMARRGLYGVQQRLPSHISVRLSPYRMNGHWAA